MIKINRTEKRDHFILDFRIFMYNSKIFLFSNNYHRSYGIISILFYDTWRSNNIGSRRLFCGCRTVGRNCARYLGHSYFLVCSYVKQDIRILCPAGSIQLKFATSSCVALHSHLFVTSLLLSTYSYTVHVSPYSRSLRRTSNAFSDNNPRRKQR